MVNAAFWKDKTVLVTGCTGFKGAWLCLWLSRMGARVVGTARSTGNPRGVFALAKLEEKITLERTDIRDETRVAEIFARHRPEVVFHLAAQPLVRLSYECPDETYAINVIGTLNVLNGIHHTPGCRCGVFVTTDRCAQDSGGGSAAKNTELLGGFDPYSNSKAAAEILIASYRATFLKPEDGFGIAMARSGNVVGGGDWAKDRLIPDCIRAMDSGGALEIRNPAATKPWQYVLDILDGYLCLAQKLCEAPAVYSTAWNFRPRDERMFTVGDMVKTLTAVYDPGYTGVCFGTPADEAPRPMQKDTSDTREALDWVPRFTARQAVESTAAWYRESRAGMGEAVCEAQLAAYLQTEQD